MSQTPKRFGSDSIAELLRSYDIPYLPMTPGASFRGLHDSIVNHLGNSSPELLICIHEEHAVAIAHGKDLTIKSKLALVINQPLPPGIIIEHPPSTNRSVPTIKSD